MPAAPASAKSGFEHLRFAPASYIEQKLGWTPWRGTPESPGQGEVLDAYTLALRQMHEKRAWEQGELPDEALSCWKPGDVIRNRLRVEAGHTVGKTKMASGMVNHFFDCFTPSIIYTFAPTWMQIHDLLWKEIKTDRRGKNLPGRILDLKLDVSDDHFATGLATSDAGGRGTERVQGQHGVYLMFVLDEAEGIPDFVWNAVDSMASGGICIVLMLANPRTRASRFYKAKKLSTVASFRISCVGHPNVIAGREVVPGAVRREYVQEMIEKHCEVVAAHEEDQHSFCLPFPVQAGDGAVHPAGTIFLPNAEFLFRVLGIAPANVGAKTLIPFGRYEAACQREAPPEDPSRARIGVDVAGFGTDYGTIYVRRAGRVWRAAQVWKQDQVVYAADLKDLALKLRDDGVTDLEIRIDAGGGFGGGVIALLQRDDELNRKPPPRPRAGQPRGVTGPSARGVEATCGLPCFERFEVIEVHFGGTPYDGSAYYDLATEMMAEAAESLKGLRLHRPPEELEADLCERLYDWVNRAGVSVKKIESKRDLRRPQRLGRSPDDGDGMLLCVAPDHLFGPAALEYT